MLKFDKVSISVKDRNILREVSFNLNPKKKYVIAGKNGEGKSLLLKSCCLLLDKNHFQVEGKIFFEGQHLDKNNLDLLNTVRKKYIRYVFQDAVKSFDPLRKLKYYFNDYIHNSEDEVKLLFRELLLDDIYKIMNSFPYEISTGQAQRVLFALGVLAKPKILILDEPTSALDQINGNIYINLLNKFIEHNNSLILIVTHDLKFAVKVCDEISYLQEGKLSNFVEPNEFLEHYKID